MDIELALASYFNTRSKLVIPNVFWSMFNYELDLLVVTEAGYGIEVEIKTSVADLRADLKKSHGHRNSKIKNLYFAMPEWLCWYSRYVPYRAGILSYADRGWRPRIKKIRKAYNNSKYVFTSSERTTLYRLGYLRMWDAKRTIRENQIQEELNRGK